MTIPCVADFVEALGQTPILGEEPRRELTALAARTPEPRELARELIRRGWLTAYQVNQLFLGRAADLVLGPYVLLERLGEGGMGQVFKARHRSLGRIVALKVVRKDYLTNPNALPRFQREIQAASQLDHPNVVRALDADQVGGTYFFAMEYIEGTELSRLVREQGPLPALQACDYIRQAALGLQHAHEKGLVHRDIKPANLLVMRPGVPTGSLSGVQLPRPFAAAYRWGLVKILDMGLARLLDQDEAPGSTMLTQIGSVMGTPDYIAPEQARNSHTSDIRADVYSLGCTLYYLLTGQAPFPGGTLTEKLLQHQLDEPEPVERVRRERLLKGTPGHVNLSAVRAGMEVPDLVLAVLRRLMAKKPEDRYQTPAEAAEALADAAVRVEASRPARPKLKPTEKTLSDEAIVNQPPPAQPTARLQRPDVRIAPAAAPAARKPPPTHRVRRSEIPPQRYQGPRTRQPLLVAGSLLLLVLSVRSFDRPRAEGPQPPSQDAAAAWARLEDRAGLAQGNLDELRGQLVAFRSAHHDSPYAARATDLLMRLPSPLDGLARSALPKRNWPGWLPKDVVAVLGEWELFSQSPATVVAFRPDGGQLARGGADQLVRRWQTAPLCELPPLRGHQVRIQPQGLAYAPDGLTLASGDFEGVVTLWDAATGQPRKRWQAHKRYPLACLAFTPDGKVLATGGWDGTVQFWDSRSGALLRTLPGRWTNRVFALAISPDGTLLACGHEDHTLRLWDLTTASVTPRAIYRGHSSWVKVVAFAPDGRTLVSGGGGEGTLHICTWDRGSFGNRRRLDGHRNVVHAVALSPDGKLVASAGEDQSVRLWDVASGKRVREWVNLRAAVNGVAFAPDGRHLAAANANSTVHILRLAAPPRAR
jgi:serine/threonine-protein kinase